MWSKTKTTRLEKVVKQFVVLMPTAFMAIAGKFSYSQAETEKPKGPAKRTTKVRSGAL